ncbi:hypothetical protein EVAR_3628_1 [Eumeta japonica]|uniref:Uncharacterized protein n=1 Tax=Eumeta variegata TaxID=151549 RepID=A0A4C1SVW1_EUMVA|nr:hypothetical protein EVAR_3628_1 [Eumeta japonica]
MQITNLTRTKSDVPREALHSLQHSFFHSPHECNISSRVSVGEDVASLVTYATELVRGSNRLAVWVGSMSIMEIVIMIEIYRIQSESGHLDLSDTIRAKAYAYLQAIVKLQVI